MKKWLRLLLQLLSVLLFALILLWAGPEPWRQILRGDQRFFLAAMGVYGAAGVISALRLRLIAHALAGRGLGSRRRFYYLNMVARTLGLVLPRSLSALGGKSVGLRALGLSLRRSLWTVLVDNAFDLLSLAVLSVPGLLYLQRRTGPGGFSVLSVVLLLLLALLSWWGTRGQRLRRVLLWAAARSPWLRERLQAQISASDRLLPDPPQALAALLWTVLLDIVLATTYYLIGRTIGLTASWWLFAAAFPLTQLSLIIAIAPGGLGIFDLGWLGLLRLGGVSQEAALTFVVAQRAYIFVYVLIWALAGVLLTLTERESQPGAPPGNVRGGTLPE